MLEHASSNIPDDFSRLDESEAVPLVAGLIECLLEENRILKEQFDKTGKKLRLDNRVPMPYACQNQDENSPIAKSERLGGLLNYYYRVSETKNGKEEARAA